MPIENLKIKASDYTGLDVAAAPDRMTGSAAENKAVFDRLIKALMAPRYNSLVDALKAASGAAEIGAASGTTVQLELDKGVKWGTGDIRYIRLNSDRVIEVSADGQSWQASGSGGHIILDSAGNLLPQRGRLRFLNGTVRDNNGVTEVLAMKGDKGDKGDRGAQGPQGIQGAKGDRGLVIVPEVDANGVLHWTIQDTALAPNPVNIRGPQGPQGVQGAQGAPGTQGAQGIQGPRGIQGPKGEQGEPGSQGQTGPQGPAGQAGPQGPMGPQGPRGDDGADGRSFTVLARYGTLLELQNIHPTGQPGDAYAIGTAEDNRIFIWDQDRQEWSDIGGLQGPMGPQGPAGAQGIQGPKGEQGEQGQAGARGPQGLQGPEGPQGPAGTQGPQGIQGVAGAAGKSAYSSATEQGYTGTEAEFGQALAQMPGHVGNGTIHVTAADKTNWNGKVPPTRKVNGKALSGDINLTAADVEALATAGGTITGNLTLKNGTNYGCKLNFGDGDYVHLSEPTDDCLEIKAKKINFVLSDTTAENFTKNGQAAIKTFTATLSASWSGSGPYTQTVTVSGLLATDNPIVDAVLSSATATAKAQRDAWALVDRIVAAANSITAYAYDKKPTTAIPIQIKVMR